MSDHGTPTNDVTMALLATRIAALDDRAERMQAEATALRTENAFLSDRITRLEGHERSIALPLALPQHPESRQPKEKGTPEPEHSVSRRGAMKALGAAAAGGVGIAVGSALMSGAPASAADGNALLVGETNNTADSRTTLTNTSGTDIGLYTVLGAASGAALRSAAIVGDSDTGTGVQGATSIAGQSGVAGADTSGGSGGSGLSGQSINGTGVVGTGPSGVSGTGTIGVVGTSNAVAGPGLFVAAGVIGQGNALCPGMLAVNSHGGPAMELFPGPTTLPATASPGQFIVLSDGSLWYAPSSNQWIQLNTGTSVHLLSGPIRVFDSRSTGSASPAFPTRPVGPLAAGSTTTLKITGATVGGVSVPAGAAGVVGNVTVTNVAANGWLNLFPHGAPAPTPATPSNINYQPSENALANFCVVALNAAGQMDIFAEAKTDVIFDVTGYL
jgi:hypothetical protein